jgi:hypothetical protein
MNAILIASLVIIVVVAIYLASTVFNLDYLIQKSTPLNPVGTILASTIDGPGSSRYFYEGWFYIHSNIPVHQENVLFRRGNEFVVALKGSTLNVYAPLTSGGKVDNESGIFSPVTTDANNNNKLISVPNFPYQKWAQLVINVDGQQVDLYIDGQFVQSIASTSTIGSTAANDIKYGNKFVDGNVARFRRPSTNINPQGVWNSYINGSGQGSSLTDYSVNVQLTKNGQKRFDAKLY